MGLDEVVLDALAFRKRGLHRLPSALNLDTLAKRPVHPLYAVVSRVGLVDSDSCDVLDSLEAELDGVAVRVEAIGQDSLWEAFVGVLTRLLEGLNRAEIISVSGELGGDEEPRLPVHHVPQEGHVVLLRSRNIHASLHLDEKLVGMPCVRELRLEAVHIFGDLRDISRNPPIHSRFSDAHIIVVVEGSCNLLEREPRKVEVKSQGNRLGRIAGLRGQDVPELPSTITALENLLTVRVTEPHHADRPTLHALGRVLREDLRFWGLLEFHARGNPELHREGVLAHLYLVCSVLKVRASADPSDPNHFDFVRKIARLRGNAEATVCVLGDSSILRDFHASRHPSFRQVVWLHLLMHASVYARIEYKPDAQAVMHACLYARIVSLSAMPPKARMNLVVDADLEEKFREAVFKAKGMKKGNISDALEEAIAAWIEAQKKGKKE